MIAGPRSEAAHVHGSATSARARLTEPRRALETILDVTPDGGIARLASQMPFVQHHLDGELFPLRGQFAKTGQRLGGVDDEQAGLEELRQAQQLDRRAVFCGQAPDEGKIGRRAVEGVREARQHAMNGAVALVPEEGPLRPTDQPR